MAVRGWGITAGAGFALAVDWASQVADGCRGGNASLEAAFGATPARARDVVVAAR